MRTPQLIVMATIQMALFFLIYRYMFGGAIDAGRDAYVDFLVPGFVTTGVLFTGIGAAVAMAEDLEDGFVDRLRSLPIPRSSVLAARAIADTAILALAPRRHRRDRLRGRLPPARHRARGPRRVRAGRRCSASRSSGCSSRIGLFAGNAQAAQGMGMIVFPFAFISSAYVPVATMPGWLQAFAEHQPLTVHGRRRRALSRSAGAGRARPPDSVVPAPALGGGDPGRLRAARRRQVPARLSTEPKGSP